MPACEMKPEDKKKYIGDVGELLVKEHGKKKHYTPAQVQQASMSCGYPIDVVCWAYCMFLTPSDFQFVHDAAGETCDYALMRTDLLSELSGSGSFLGIDLSLSWLDWPDIDLGGMFDWFDFPDLS